ncbi:hypothetical protein O9X98_15130 [Agrobacterium salinitolerans]|nr:hypothetical protein [Agrobacterium salinitolerans]
MTHVKIPDVDYARAKNAAKAVKSRLHDLGNEVCLNHAYEAVAAGLGFKTWAVMKASLDGDQSAIETPPATSYQAPREDRPKQGGLTWHDLRLGEYNPVVMIHGPSGRKRDIVMREIASQIEKPPRRIRGISFGKPDDRLALALMGGDWSRDPNEQPNAATFVLDPMSQRSAINIFDLPFRSNRPSPAHLRRIVSFLAELTLVNQVSSGEAFLSDAVNQLYTHFIDREPLKYQAGVVPQIDEFCQQAGLVLDEGDRSWRNLALKLASKLQPKLAGIAWRHGSPRLEHFMVVIRDEVLMDTYGTVRMAGERMVDACMRMVSSAIRTYPFLQRPTARDLGQTRVEIIGIELADGQVSAAASLLYKLAFEASVLEYGEVRSDTHLLISGAELVSDDLQGLLERAHEEDGPRIVLVTAETARLSALDRFVTSHVVTGCSTRASVQDLCDKLKIGPAGFESIHERLFGAHDENKLETFCVRKKFVTQREGLVVIPVRRDR